MLLLMAVVVVEVVAAVGTKEEEEERGGGGAVEVLLSPPSMEEITAACWGWAQALTAAGATRQKYACTSFVSLCGDVLVVLFCDKCKCVCVCVCPMSFGSSIASTFCASKLRLVSPDYGSSL